MAQFTQCLAVEKVSLGLCIFGLSENGITPQLSYTVLFIGPNNIAF